MADDETIVYDDTYFYAFLAFLLFLLVLTIYFFYIQYRQVKNNNINLYKAPTAVQCPDPQCTTGDLAIVTEPDGLYQTLNWCSVQAPATSFVQAMAVGAGIETTPAGVSLTPPSKEEVTKFAKYYNDYVTTCGQSWKNPPPMTRDSPTAEPDPVVTALVAYAEKLGISNNSDITALKSKNDNLNGTF